MAQEIERKFLVKADWQPTTAGTRIAQGYLNCEPQRTVRVRIRQDKGYLTIKGKNEGISRLEFEYEIPLAEAEQLLLLCEQPLVEKMRYVESYGGFEWEVDVFSGVNEGLIVAEIELPTKDTVFTKPSWIGKEVSGDSRFYNSNLIKNPYKEWKCE